MNINTCPDCNVPLEWDKGYYCETCHHRYDKQADCPTCQHLLEKIVACGVTDYFCNQCNSLVSKSKLTFVFVKSDYPRHT